MSPLTVGALVALALGVGGPVVLRRLDALDRWPRLAAWLWLALPLGALGALMFVAGLLMLADHALVARIAGVLHLCASVLTGGLAGPAQTAPVLAGALLGVLVAGTVHGVIAGPVRSRRGVRRHRDLLVLTAVEDARVPGVRVLEHPTPVAYSLADGTGTIVVSTGTLDCLTGEQLAAVIAHEQAHQRGRHHLLVLVAQVLRVGFPWLPAARLGCLGVERSVELAADDHAVRRCGRQQLVQALLRLHQLPVTPSALGMVGGRGGPSAAERVTRLLRPAARRRLPVAASLGAVGVLFLLPLVSIADPIGHVTGVSLPLAHAPGMHLCPLP